MPNAMAGAVSPFPTMAGAAASLQGFAMMAVGALSGLVLSGLGGGVASLALMMCALAAVGTAIFVWANRQGSATVREKTRGPSSGARLADKWGAVPSSRLIRPRRTAAVARGSADWASSITPRQGLVRFAPVSVIEAGQTPARKRTSRTWQVAPVLSPDSWPGGVARIPRSNM